MGAVGRKPREPQDKAGIGYRLFHIIGGVDANFGEVGERLGISGAMLSNYVHGRGVLRPARVEAKGWVEIFKRDFAKGWAEHGEAFMGLLQPAPAKTAGAAEDTSQGGKRHRVPKTPSDTASLGYKLFQIIGGTNAALVNVAPKLGVSANQLSTYLHGHVPIRRSQFDKKGWQAVLEKDFAQGWAEHGAAFMAQFEAENPARPEAAAPAARASKAPKGEKPAHAGNPAKRIREPEDKASLGYKLYEIIGGADAKVGATGDMLGVGGSRLSAFLHGGAPLRQSLFDAKNWKTILAANFPAAWEEKGPAFLAQLKAESDAAPRKGGGRAPGPQGERAPKAPKMTRSFNATRRGKPSKRPENEETLGFVLWSIMGERNFRLADAVPILRLDEVKIGNLIHNRGKVPQSFIDNQDWAGRLAARYPEAWAVHAEAFARYKTIMPPLSREEERAAKKAETPDPAQAWRQVIGSTISAIVENRGDDIDVLKEETTIPALKNTWERVLAGDPGLCETIFRDAVRTTVKLYGLESARDPAEQAALKVLRRNMPEMKVYA